MTLKMNTTDEFVVSMNLNIDYSSEQINLRVYSWDKKTQRVNKQDFSASEFPAALRFYDEEEKTLERKYLK